MSFWRPRTIRLQLTLGLLLIKVLSILLFVGLLIHQQRYDVLKRAQRRLEYQTNSLAIQVRQAIQQDRPILALNAIDIVISSRSMNWVKVTDPSGNTLFSQPASLAGQRLTAEEQEQFKKLQGDSLVSYTIPNEKYGHLYAGMRPVYVAGIPRAYIWIYTNTTLEQEELAGLLRITAIFAFIWISATLALSWMLAQSITRPLADLLQGTRAVIHSPELLTDFPLSITSYNEIADLTRAFNLMVAAIEEQRAGLRDTLSLLDSMLAHAPIGFAFLDRRCRFVRVNGFFAEMMGDSTTRFIGRTVGEMLPASCAQTLEKAVEAVFLDGQPVVDMELSMQEESVLGPGTNRKGKHWSWLTRIYPVRTRAQEVSWVGVIAMDTSERKRSEEVLRRTEKLAAAGKLAASIAHEINNPLEAVTNLLYLLRGHTALDPVANQYAMLAEHEVRRVSEITQQTLRFYRQNSQASLTDVCELMDSVLNLHRGHQLALNIEIRKEYSPPAELFCYSGEIRQVFANLVGNALDSMQAGGVLWLRIRRAHNWQDGTPGIRIVVADTGTGMMPEVREHIFDAFFTTKEVTGTGLGLWVSNEIILKHQGHVQVRSRVADIDKKSGSVFALFFPDMVDERSHENTATVAANKPLNTGNVSI